MAVMHNLAVLDLSKLESARHDRLQDEWAKLAQMAGWTTATEQAIPVAPIARSSRPRRLSSIQAAGAAPETMESQVADAASFAGLLGSTVRADLIFLTPGGKKIVGDVAVTHSWLPHSCSDALIAMENTKYKKYCVPDSNASMPGGELFFPLVHHPSGQMGAAAVKLAMHIVDDLAGKLRSRMRMSKPKAQQHATFVVYGSLGRILQQQECRVLAASAPLVAARPVMDSWRYGE
eukprot:980368-Amphidinium_carterae.1